MGWVWGWGGPRWGELYEVCVGQKWMGMGLGGGRGGGELYGEGVGLEGGRNGQMWGWGRQRWGGDV